MNEIILKYASIYELDPLMVLAIIKVESQGNPHVTRFEPNYKYFYRVDEFAKKLSPPATFDTERVHQQTSWGLMQIMGAVAREHGFTGHIPQLLDPDTNISYGCKHLARVRRAGYSDLDQIAAYNAGIARKMITGIYVNQGYVTKVLYALEKLKNTPSIT